MKSVLITFAFTGFVGTAAATEAALWTPDASVADAYPAVRLAAPVGPGLSRAQVRAAIPKSSAASVSNPRLLGFRTPDAPVADAFPALVRRGTGAAAALSRAEVRNAISATPAVSGPIERYGA